MEVPITGSCGERFTAVREAFAANFADRGEVGGAVTVLLGGSPVVELVGGWADAARTRPWEPDTLVDVYSVGKAVVALLALQSVDRGLLGLDDPVASVWPEFAAGGSSPPPSGTPSATGPASPPSASPSPTTTSGSGNG